MFHCMPLFGFSWFQAQVMPGLMHGVLVSQLWEHVGGRGYCLGAECREELRNLTREMAGVGLPDSHFDPAVEEMYRRGVVSRGMWDCCIVSKLLQCCYSHECAAAAYSVCSRSILNVLQQHTQCAARLRFLCTHPALQAVLLRICVHRPLTSLPGRVHSS